MRKNIYLAMGLLALAGACETDRSHSDVTTNSTVETDVRQVGRDVKAGVERAGDKLQNGVHKASDKIKDAAHDVKDDLTRK